MAAVAALGAFLANTVVPALTGGLGQDDHAGPAVSLAHLYTWLAFFAVPFAISMVPFTDSDLACGHD